jgi:hypothetical protein
MEVITETNLDTVDRVDIAKMLYYFIGEISEIEYSAGWMTDIEYRVWFDDQYPTSYIRTYQIENPDWKASLAFLGKKYNVWVKRDEGGGFQVLTIAEWQEDFNKWMHQP